jgi:ketosteroid isomerase-like protein
MGAKENLELIEQVQRANRDRDYDRYGALLADDAVLRMAGVPAAMGGVTKGKQAIVDQFRATAGGAGGDFQVKQAFGDDEHVCVVGKLVAQRFPGNQFLKGADRPYGTYECIVYRIADGKVAEQTTYLNWLDAYVQVGLVDPSTFTA